MKKAVLLPLVLFLAGVAVYVYNGIYHHAWMDNLPNIIIFFFIVVFLAIALRKKEKMSQWRKDKE
ncbi:MAG: hypothetical protein IJ163_03535 [Bacteroidaceae bacterium]|jgi:hypothetical protein|nr:hypothetical protein [Bacteroidaceae bacterium]